MLIILSWLLSHFLVPTDVANVRATEQHAVIRHACDAPLIAQPHDCPERMSWALLAISNRESPGNWSPERIWTGLHAGDAKHSPSAKRNGLKSGRLKWWCPAHWGDEGFATVGPHGMFYVYNVQRLDALGNCIPWWVMAINVVSADIAARRYIKVCDDDVYSPNVDAKAGDGWCPTLADVIATRRRARQRGYAKKRPQLSARLGPAVN